MLQLVAGRSQTCASAGEKAYYVCADGENPCGRFFEDKDAATEITADIGTWKVISAGYVFGEWIAEVPAPVAPDEPTTPNEPDEPNKPNEPTAPTPIRPG